MILLVTLVLALLPLLGIGWILIYGSITTVDGLFTSLILAAMSGILGLNVLLELKHRSKADTKSATNPVIRTSNGLSQRGRVDSVAFYESNVGQPNKSIVMLSNGASASNMLVFEGDLRNALPVGQRVEITFRKADGYNVLVNVNYASA
jgi:hypothetical protein